MDIRNCSTSEKSKTGEKMPLLMPGTEDVLVHQDEKDKEPREMFLMLLGPESPKTRRVVAAIQHRAAKKKDGHSPSDDQIEAEARSESKMLAELTVGGLVFLDGKWVDVNTENAFDIYHAVMGFRKQATDFIFDLGNYTKG